MNSRIRWFFAFALFFAVPQMLVLFTAAESRVENHLVVLVFQVFFLGIRQGWQAKSERQIVLAIDDRNDLFICVIAFWAGYFAGFSFVRCLATSLIFIWLYWLSAFAAYFLHRFFGFLRSLMTRLSEYVRTT